MPKGFKIHDLKKNLVLLQRFISSLTVERKTWGGVVHGKLQAFIEGIALYTGGKIIGIVYVTPHCSVGLVIKKEYQDKGLGQYLLRQLEKRCRKNIVKNAGD